MCVCVCVCVCADYCDNSETSRYRTKLQWEDQSIAYYLPLISHLQNKQMCYNLFFQRRKIKYLSQHLSPCKCDECLANGYLCESPPQHISESPISLPAVTEGIHAVSVIACPHEHLTQQFLACDVKSRCWADAHGASYSCSVSLTPLPPMMTCSDGVQRVPYTLVCDHRPDCDDKSDEEFCVFPQCQLSESFDCGNQEVG